MKLNILFTPEEMDYVAKVLAQRPWGEVNSLIMNIQQQLQEQQNARNQPISPPGVSPTGVPGGPGGSGDSSAAGIQP